MFWIDHVFLAALHKALALRSSMELLRDLHWAPPVLAIHIQRNGNHREGRISCSPPCWRHPNQRWFRTFKNFRPSFPTLFLFRQSIHGFLQTDCYWTLEKQPSRDSLPFNAKPLFQRPLSASSIKWWSRLHVCAILGKFLTLTSLSATTYQEQSHAAFQHYVRFDPYEAHFLYHSQQHSFRLSSCRKSTTASLQIQVCQLHPCIVCNVLSTLQLAYLPSRPFLQHHSYLKKTWVALHSSQDRRQAQHARLFCTHGLAPSYLSSKLPSVPCRLDGLRLRSSNHLRIPRVRRPTIGGRRFPRPLHAYGTACQRMSLTATVCEVLSAP